LLVGELVLTRNQVVQYVGRTNDTDLIRASQRLNLIASELQEGVMKTRMQPIGNLWNKFPRLVRDVAASLGKRIRVEMEGQDVEVDRSILEAVKDPLTHVIRNACDHGIETPEARLAAGKPAEGRVRLAAYHEGGQVILEISDDGGGVRPDRIRARALERGVITPAQAERMTPREVQNLVFLPGFSTAEAVTKVSGRGVGMDVVKTNVERIGGAVDLASEPGEGATLRIRIPLTLAIVPALTVRCGADRYAIPQVSLLELVRLDSEHGVESFHGAPVYRLRGKLLPLVRLADLVGRTGAAPAPSAGPDADAEHIVVLQADDRVFGLVVDGVCDTGEIVVKPLAKRLKKIGLYAGATIMGDGGVTLILDVAGLAHAGRIAVARRRDVLRDADSDAASLEPRPSSDRGPRAWLVAASGGRRYAIPLESVTRLEEFKPSAFERAAGIEVAQYRGDLLPVVRLCTFFGEACPTASEVDARGGVPVIVCGDGDRVAGVVVEEVVDVVEEAVTVRRDVRGRGLAGVAVIQGRTVDVLDLQALVEEGLRTAPRR
ncbi:MAG TPA: chemotaxis protein CheA, partial [Planctomycetota bacterium]|nr:chemotaxis protein CheA [Planctomycetota bacterium]